MNNEAADSPDERFVRETGLAAAVAALTEPVLSASGFRLVRVHVTGGQEKTVQIMAERPDGTFTIDDCEAISRQVSPLFDAHDVIAGRYRLEISSPGIDRPLVRPSDFVTWAGHDAKIETKEPAGGRRRFRGRIEGVEAGEVKIRTGRDGEGTEQVSLPFHMIVGAKLVLTEELVRDSLRRAKLREKERAAVPAGAPSGHDDGEG